MVVGNVNVPVVLEHGSRRVTSLGRRSSRRGVCLEAENHVGVEDWCASSGPVGPGVTDLSTGDSQSSQWNGTPLVLGVGPYRLVSPTHLPQSTTTTL